MALYHEQGSSGSTVRRALQPSGALICRIPFLRASPQTKVLLLPFFTSRGYQKGSSYAEILGKGAIKKYPGRHKTLIPDLQPYLIDVTTYTRYLPAGIPFGDEYAARLRHLAEDPAYAPWHPLLQAMLKHRKWEIIL